MRVLVTGGAGFLGSHLVRRLLADGHEVIALDNLETSTWENLADVLSSPRLARIEHDVTSPYDVGRVDRVYNLACAASPPRYQARRVHTTLTSVLGTLHALEAASRHGARVLQASTSEVYGDPEVHPQREDYRGSVDPVGPRACYDEGKRCAETLVMDYHREHGADVRIVRIFNTYGPAMDPADGRVVSNFIRQALEGEPLTVYGDGTQTRSLCYVDDLVDGLVGVMERARTPEPINLGNPTEMTVREIAERVLRAVGGGRIVHRPLPADDPKRRRPDIARAYAEIGFTPRVAFDVGLPRTIEWFRRRLSKTAPARATGAR
ncbi:MAG TPA: UDP-glucuronic acid decarboxylase family protein [Sandaracinaceae bacterium]